MRKSRPSRFHCKLFRKSALLILFVLSIIYRGHTVLSLNVFPQETYIDLDAPGVNGFNIQYQLFGSQFGAGAASANLAFYYCNDPDPFSGQCILLDNLIINLNCNGLNCSPPPGLQNFFISEISLPSGFTNTCFPGNWYIVGIITGNTGALIPNSNPTPPVEFAHSRPDLEPFSITVNPDLDNPGQFQVECAVVNNGPCSSPSSNATIWLTPGTGVPVLFDVPALSPGTGVIVSVTYNNLTPGQTYDARLTVDPSGQIDERDEVNNVLEINSIYTFPLPPLIGDFTPSSGTIGSVITINGVPNFSNVEGDFDDVARVLINGAEVPIIFRDALTLEVSIPYFTTSGPITLETIYGTSTVSSSNFEVLCSPDFADMEIGNFPFPWGIFNPDNDQTFQLYTGGGAGGSNNSVVMYHRDYSSIGAFDYIDIPHVCIDSDPNWKLKMDYAYTYYSIEGVTLSDNLYVIDLLTGNIIATFLGENIATAPPQATTYVPDPADWSVLEVDLSSYAQNGQTILYLSIVTENGNGNSMYLDNIRLDNTATPLPVELTRFNAYKEDQNVKLKWLTEQETDNDYFVIERSMDGVDFEKIGTVNGKGTTTATNYYTFIDYSPMAGDNYYRLIQVDLDGTETTSEIRNVNFATDNIISIFPNPGNGILTISTSSSDPTKVEVFSIEGRLIKSINAIEQNSIDLSDLPGGTYFLRFADHNQSYTKKYTKL